jgi:hypothetical protein
VWIGTLLGTMTLMFIIHGIYVCSCLLACICVRSFCVVAVLRLWCDCELAVCGMCTLPDTMTLVFIIRVVRWLTMSCV